MFSKYKFSKIILIFSFLALSASGYAQFPGPSDDPPPFDEEPEDFDDPPPFDGEPEDFEPGLSIDMYVFPLVIGGVLLGGFGLMRKKI